MTWRGPFDLLGLDPFLLEQVLTKVNGQSYLLLQQTCHTVNELIQASQKIRVYISGRFLLSVYRKRLFCEYCPLEGKSDKVADVEGLHGARLSLLEPPVIFIKDTGCFVPLCDALKKHRITCVDVRLGRTMLTKEQCAMLLDILKPRQAQIFSEGADRFEALLDPKNTLEFIYVILNMGKLDIAVEKAVSIGAEVTISHRNFTLDIYSPLRTILGILLSQPVPNLQRLSATVNGRGNMPTKEGLENELFEFNLTMDAVTPKEISAFVTLPQYFPERSSCKIQLAALTFNDLEATIDYSNEDAVLNGVIKKKIDINLHN